MILPRPFIATQYFCVAHELGGLAADFITLAVRAMIEVVHTGPGVALGDHPAYLAPGRFVDSDHPAIRERAASLVAGAVGDREKAVRLFHHVRDGWRYDPFHFRLTPEHHTASTVLGVDYGYCITKAVLLLFGSTVLSLLVMAEFDFSFERLFRSAVDVHKNGLDIMAPGGIVSDPLSVLSLGTALVFGTAGLPHILMRFFTVPDARAARHSVFVATGLIGYFYLLIVILGFGAIALLAREPQFLNAAGTLRGGDNMAAIHLSHVVAGDLFLGFISAVAFATILAVVSGLALAGGLLLGLGIGLPVQTRGAVRRDALDEVNAQRRSAIAKGAAQHASLPEQGAPELPAASSPAAPQEEA